MALINYKGYTFNEGTNDIIPLYDYDENNNLEILYQPSPTILEWLQTSTKEHGLIGGRGSGKSVALAYKCMEICNTYPGINILIVRKTKDVVKETAYQTFLDTIPPELIAFQHEKLGILDIACNGDKSIVSRIQFLGSDRGRGQQKWRGRKFGAFCIEEAQEFSAREGQRLYEELLIAMRQPGYPRYFAMTIGNPNGQNWQYRLYKDRNGVPVTGRELYIVSSLENACNLPKGYIQTIIDTYPPELVKRYIEGSCDVADGLIFKEFGDTHLISSYEYPLQANWRYVTATDPSPGVVTPFATLFCAIDHKGNYILFDEYYEIGDRLEPHAKGILDKRDKIHGYVEVDLIDHQANTKTREKDHGSVSVRTDLAEYGLHTVNANKNIREGILRMIEVIHTNHKSKHPVTGHSPAPRLYIFKDKCPNIIRQLNSYMWNRIEAENGSEAPKENQEDHLIDALRYIVNYAYENAPIEEQELDRRDSLMQHTEKAYLEALENSEKEIEQEYLWAD